MKWPVRVDPIYGCWLWQDKLDRDGYGIVWRGQRPNFAHRVVYEAERGPVPQGKELDHLCRRRACVRPEHVAIVDRRENQRRKRWRNRVKLTTCPQGHDMSVNKLITPEGGIVCRECSERRTKPDE